MWVGLLVGHGEKAEQYGTMCMGILRAVRMGESQWD